MGSLLTRPFCSQGLDTSIQLSFRNVHGQENTLKVQDGLQVWQIKIIIHELLTRDVPPERMTLTHVDIELCNDKYFGKDMVKVDRRFQQHRRIVSPTAIVFEDVNKKRSTISFDCDWTGMDLKEHLFFSLKLQELRPDQMSLTLGATVLENEIQIKNVGLVLEQETILKQSKQSLMRISSLNAIQAIDPFTNENECCLLPCRHHMGRDAMRWYLEHILVDNSYRLECRHQKQENQAQLCLHPLDFNICAEIAVLTATEKRRIQMGLLKNYLNFKKNNCPEMKIKQSENVFLCNSCDEDSQSSKESQGYHSTDSQGCHCSKDSTNTRDQEDSMEQSSKEQLIYQHRKEFCLKDLSDLTWKQFKVSLVRKCPQCEQSFQHDNGCKHVQCPNCFHQFCWLCLKSPMKGIWACGKAYDYCGKITLD